MSLSTKGENPYGNNKQSSRTKDYGLQNNAARKPHASSSGKRRHRLRFHETINPHAERICNITAMDVVFGRGRALLDYPGNKRMRAIASNHKARYQTMELSAKRNFVEAVYDEIIRDGARFLYKQGEEEGFVKVEVPVALQKVRNLLRCKKEFEKKTSLRSKKSALIHPSGGGNASS